MSEEFNCTVGEFMLREVDQCDDIVTTWHEVYTTKKVGESNRIVFLETLDFDPYHDMGEDIFKVFVSFHQQHDRFPTRDDIGSEHSIKRDDIDCLKLLV